jgi:flavin reductase (DIM6/NTAB) family NADH-FMN oxidoreductase RutF
MLEKLGRQNALYPMPVTLVGTLVEGKVNFLNIAHVGIFNAAAPHRISLGMGKGHYSNRGIREQKTFSVNLPSQDMVVAADWVGLVSGKSKDKSQVFETFFGELATAPLIKSCPVAMECRLVQTVDTPTHDVFVGEIAATWADPAVLTEGKIDLAKVRPLLFDMASCEYWTLGEPIAQCWHEGKKFQPR